MSKPISNRILLLVFFSASVTFVAGVFAVVVAGQLLHMNGMSLPGFFIGAYDTTHILSLDSLLMGARVLLMGIAKIWISSILYILIFIEKKSQAKHMQKDELRAKER